MVVMIQAGFIIILIPTQGCMIFRIGLKRAHYLFLDCDGAPVANESIHVAPQKSSISFDGEHLYVTFDDDALFDVTVYTMQGTVLMQRKDNRKAVTIPLNDITYGVNIVQITADQYSYTHKFVR
jgi:hypothetical protein